MPKYKKPKPTIVDHGHTLARAGLSSLPHVGGAVAELFNAIITPPLDKRRDAWVESIATGLLELETKFKGFSIDDLAKSDAFITTAIQATRIAISNHHKAKLDALRNAVLNSASPNFDLDGDIQLIFLNLIESLTPAHLRLLDRLGRNDYMTATINHETGFPCTMGEDFEKNPGLLEIIGDDLVSKKLLSANVNAFASHQAYDFKAKKGDEIELAGGIVYFRGTELGKKFLSFISTQMGKP